MNTTKTPDTTASTAAPADPAQIHEVRFGDRGDASGRNIEQNRAIEQDDPLEGSRQGRTLLKNETMSDSADPGTDAAQVEEAERVRRDKR